MCCKLLGVAELNKPAGRWCDLVQIGQGCGDYEHRPQSCHDFVCLWLSGEAKAMTEDMRPDKIKAVLSTTEDGTRCVVYIDPATPDHYKTNRLLGDMIHRMRLTVDVIIVCGDRRKLLPSRENAAKYL
jgi:hypothetical protein